MFVYWSKTNSNAQYLEDVRDLQIKLDAVALYSNTSESSEMLTNPDFYQKELDIFISL